MKRINRFITKLIKCINTPSTSVSDGYVNKVKFGDTILTGRRWPGDK